MRVRVACAIAGCALLLATLAGCAVAPPAPTSAVPTSEPSATQEPLTLADAEDCPVTQPGDGPPDVPPGALFGWSSSYGNGELWVGGLGPGGVIAAGPRFINPDGSVDMKFGWWRVVPGELTITGRRLDGPAPPARAGVPDGYGESGFQASGVTFPTEGCWEVTGHVGTASLTFVTFVLKEG
jgi:hypothetical protein